MKQLASETGAVAYFPQQPAELPGIASGIANELAHQYSLAYLPAPAGAASSLRSVAVRLAGRPGLTARTRTNYRADGAVSGLSARR